MIVDVTPLSNAPPSVPEPEPEPAKEPSRIWPLVRKYVLAPIPVILLVVVACILVACGVEHVQIGGLIGKLLGKKPGPEQKTIHIANSVPAERVREDGTLIAIGEPDSKGLTQAQVVAIEKPGLFGDPKTVKIVVPGTNEPVVVQIPDGVKAKDIEHVVIIKPTILAVTVKSSSAIKAQDVDDLLAKYKK
jgi:hypothetical protein